MLRTGDMVSPSHYTFLTSDVDGGEKVTDYLKGCPCLVLGLDDVIWNPKNPRKRTKRVLLFDPQSCKVGWADVRWVRRIK